MNRRTVTESLVVGRLVGADPAPAAGAGDVPHGAPGASTGRPRPPGADQEPGARYDQRMGRPPLEVPFVMLSLKIAPEIKARLEEYARLSGVPMADVVMRALEAYTARRRKVVPWPRKVVRRGQVPKR